MSRKEENIGKSYDELSFGELDKEALIEHALTLGDEAEEALEYLEEIYTSKIPYTEEMKDFDREKLKYKTKRKKGEDGKFIYLDEPLYNNREIELVLSKKKEVRKYTPLAARKMYCEKYYPEILPETTAVDEEAKFKQMIAEAKAKLKKSKRK
ncbi:hypothetical protein LJC34_06435 [Oscillospiraceae bacterium OttesenSCG-928-G22]|nr:hypothetical protein [Oscillospiraceae bacterium OttesenSCG-928-G22]